MQVEGNAGCRYSRSSLNATAVGQADISLKINTVRKRERANFPKPDCLRKKPGVCKVLGCEGSSEPGVLLADPERFGLFVKKLKEHRALCELPPLTSLPKVL